MVKQNNALLFFTLLFLLSTAFYACNNTGSSVQEDKPFPEFIVSDTSLSKPYSRYWWFASEIKKEDIRYNLDWLKENGFGGVEIAWVYPLNAINKNLDQTYTPRQKWLSPQWQQLVEFTIRYADSIGIGCDLTMGTLWPFGDSYVTYEQASQRFGEIKRQKISKSWEHPQSGYVVNHINPDHYLPYFERLLDSFPQPKTNISQAYFIDSWEVKTEKLWTDGFDTEFKQKYGYDILPNMNNLYDEKNKEILYDYRKLISEKVVRFYRDFDSVLNEAGIMSRGQCSGAPCDIISAYSFMDIPEGEAMLYEAEYNSIPSSAALLSGKNKVSAETFTCLYGWPRHYIREEQTADLKLVADAMFANGINKIIWHGKAHNPKDQDTTNFYATVHLGNDGSLAGELPAFNRYLSTVSGYMQMGRTYSDVAVYLPAEDAWIKGLMPKEKQFIWAKEYYEMRYVYFPTEVRGFHPVWINSEFLNNSSLENGVLKIGEASFRSLYVDANYMDISALKRITELAINGFPVTMKKTPVQAGTIKHAEWPMLIQQLSQLPNVDTKFETNCKPLVEANVVPMYWARETNQSLIIFFAHPKCKNIKFPVEYGQSYSEEIIKLPVTINYMDKQYKTELVFSPYQSLLYEIKNGQLEELNISYHPKTPVVKERPRDFKAPWKVK